MKLLFGYFTENMSYPASMLADFASKNGWDVELVFFEDSDSDEVINRKINEFIPDLVTLSFKTFERKKAFQVAKIARLNNIKVIAGGLHPTACPEDLEKSGYFDAIVVGDGMGIFDKILGSFRDLRGGKIIKGKRCQDLAYYTRRYFSESQKKQIRESKAFEVLTGIGCPYNCHFCSTTKNFIELPIDDVAKEIYETKKSLDFGKIIIYDDTFTYKSSRIREFRLHMERYGLSFSYSMQARVNCFSEEVAKELVAMGVEEVGFGVETTSLKLLNFLNKRTRPEDAYAAAKICRKYGIAFKANFMFGLPRQDRDDYEITYRFIRDVKPDAIFLYFFMPFPGSFLFDYCVKNRYLPEHFSFDSLSNKNSRGIQKNIGFLKNIDYDMATEYADKITRFHEGLKEKSIFDKLAKVDDKGRSILFGTGDFFYRTLEKISTYHFKNCAGYYDYNVNAFKATKYSVSVDKFTFDKNTAYPKTIVVTTHFGRDYHKIILPLLAQKFSNKDEVVSISTYAAKGDDLEFS